MKPVHHALVSSKIFGGPWQAYEPIHTAFDCSKAALGDMRHRAALHSVDHGGAVMAMRFANTVFPNASTTQLVEQHVDDDQGFAVALDDWLGACSVPPSLLGTRTDGPLVAFLSTPEEACAQKWGGQPEDYAAVCAYFALPEQFSDHRLAPAVSRNAFGIFFAESIFGPALSITHKGRTRPVCVRDIGEDLTMARYGRLPSLGDVFAKMRREDWMMGSKVAASRAHRIATSGRTDLFAMAD